MKFSKMSDKKLNILIEKATAEQRVRIAREQNKDKAQKIANKLLKEYGIAAEELFGGMFKSRKISKVAPKWRHKEDNNLTWSGRGRTPKWIKRFGVKI